jgi:osmotically-inducible protein OsmY
VIDRLRADRRLRGARIDVDVQVRVVVLAGHVAADGLRRAAGDICWATPGCATCATP